MTDSNQHRKKKKITYTASPQGIKKAEKALKRLGFESKNNFAKSNFLSRSTVTKFFNRQEIQFDSLKRICEALKVDWEELLLMGEEEPVKLLEIAQPSNLETNEGVEQVQMLSRQVTVLDKQSQVIKAVIILEGDFNSINNNFLISLPAILREFSGDTIRITDIQEGSIQLIIEGSLDDIEQLISRFNSGKLTEVSGFPVRDIQILSESSDDNESNELNDKWRLVQEIVSQTVDAQNLSGADLSDADLSSAYLNNADLSDADLSDADLSSANLNRANLIGTNLYDANLTAANLRGSNLRNANLTAANLNRADLSRANLRGANLTGANLNRANLNRAKLIGSNLHGINLTGAILWDANLTGAILLDANLSSAFLFRANLSSANLSSANLSGADLTGAILLNANLSGANLAAIVEKARFGDNLGLTEEMELDLKQRGAIFKDSSGDRSEVLNSR